MISVLKEVALVVLGLDSCPKELVLFCGGGVRKGIYHIRIRMTMI
jgi:hypothetical protein